MGLHMKHKRRLFHYVVFLITFFICVFLLWTVLRYGLDFTNRSPYRGLIVITSFLGAVTLPIVVVIILSRDKR